MVPSGRFFEPTTERTRFNKVAKATECIRCVESGPLFIPTAAEESLFVVVVNTSGVCKSLSEFAL